MRIGVIGSGQVGQVLASGLKSAGHDVRIASRTPEKLSAFAVSAGIHTGTFSDVAAWGEALVLAVLGRAADEALHDCGETNLEGKLVIDTTNPISEEPPEDGVVRFFTGPNESLMEGLQTAFPGVRFVKAFNSVGSGLMINPQLGGARPTMFLCGDDAAAKTQAARIVEQFGWEPLDMGTAKAARAIEPLCQLWCIPGFRENRWNDHAFKLLTR